MIQKSCPKKSVKMLYDEIMNRAVKQMGIGMASPARIVKLIFEATWVKQCVAIDNLKVRRTFC